MLLSIVMMIKNEERHLEKTLKQLMPLMDNIDSELIILDTGSTDASIEIAKKYTEKLYFAEWNNNFADMRNISLSYAKGEWVLILDADEELIDYKNLIDFFETGKDEEYNSATIELKNIFSEDEKRYNKSSLLRLFKNIDGFKYEGAIHEQPKYKYPIYNNVATFKHYGYMFINEELRQMKTKRNMDILFKELDKNPNHAYTNYQISQSYYIISRYEDTLFYLKKAYTLYKKSGRVPLFVTGDLVRLYSQIGKYSNCEKICEKYIKNDNKNIDIYYYLALSKQNLGKLEESIKYWERYLYLLDNYEISTQANDMECMGDTVSFRSIGILNIMKIYYNMENYIKVIEKVSKIDIEIFNQSQYIILDSLYRLNRLDEIVELYNKKTNTISEKKKFKLNLEHMLLKSKECDKEKICNIYTNLEGNYSILNNARMNKKISVEICNKILKNESDAYYGDILYYAINQKFDLCDVLSGTDYLDVGNYFDYIVINRKNVIIDLYNYLIESSNTLQKSKLHIYSSLSKSLLNYGNLIGDKYKKIFLLYITYSYICIKYVYSSDMTDEEILRFVRDKEDKFILKLMEIKLKNYEDKAAYIKDIKALLIENQHHKYGLDIIIKEFEKNIYQSDEVKELKSRYIDLIKSSIQCGKLDEAKIMILEYENIYGDEDILNIKAVHSIYKGETLEAEKLLKMAYLNDIYNVDILFNIAYLKETIGENHEAKNFYLEILKITNDIEIKKELSSKLSKL